MKALDTEIVIRTKDIGFLKSFWAFLKKEKHPDTYIELRHYSKIDETLTFMEAYNNER